MTNEDHSTLAVKLNMKTTCAPKPQRMIGVRHKQAVILFLGFVVAYAQRVNLSMGIVAMTDPKGNTNFPTLNYTTEDKGRISGMFFYGYLIAGVPAGILADKYGPIRLLSVIGGVFCGLATIAIPFAALHVGIYAVYALRIAQGLGQALFFPCVNAMVSKWIIPQERGQFSWLWTGVNLGTIIMMATGGELAAGASGWPSIFYYSGSCGMIWGIFCIVFGADSPAVHKSITLEERNYIESNMENPSSKEKLKIPWCSLATSVPFLTLALTHLCQNWGYFTLLTLIPTYIHGVYGFDEADNGFLSALPYIGTMLGGFAISPLAAVLSRRFSSNFNRKFFNSIGFYGCALSLALLSSIKTNAFGAVALLTAATTLNSGVFSGFQINHLDLAPNFAGILMGITNAGSNFGSIIAPQFATHVVKDESNNSQWQIVFLVSAAVYIVGNTAFLIFGSTERQAWNELLTSADTPKDKTESSRNDDGVNVIDMESVGSKPR